MSDRVQARVGLHFLPHIHVNTSFSNIPHGKFIYHVVVEVNKQSFHVCSYTNRRLPPSHSVTKIKESSIWKGEIVVFPISANAKRYVCRPSVSDAVIDHAVFIFVSRVTEALDAGKQVPGYIHGVLK